MLQHAGVITDDHAQVKRRAPAYRQRFGKPFPASRQQPAAENRQEYEHRAPAERGLQPAADQWRDGGCQAEHHRHQCHGPLGLGALEPVLHHGARDHHASCRRQALQQAQADQRLCIRREGARQRSDGEQSERCQHDGAPAERIGQRAVEQGHDGQAEHVDRECLLDHQRSHAELPGDGGKRRQVGIDPERADHGQQGEYEGQGGVGH